MEDMTSKDEDLERYDTKLQGLTIFQATLVEDMTSKDEDLNGISSNPSGGYDIKR